MGEEGFRHPWISSLCFLYALKHCSMFHFEPLIRCKRKTCTDGFCGCSASRSLEALLLFLQGCLMHNCTGHVLIVASGTTLPASMISAAHRGQSRGGICLHRSVGCGSHRCTKSAQSHSPATLRTLTVTHSLLAADLSCFFQLCIICAVVLSLLLDPKHLFTARYCSVVVPPVRLAFGPSNATIHSRRPKPY